MKIKITLKIFYYYFFKMDFNYHLDMYFNVILNILFNKNYIIFYVGMMKININYFEFFMNY